ncbi:hypothetical protein TWF694_002023 [Orbilia ellipsospora]|uniref:Uncharacterized protein n=1 Tax=Orbilia ellipsospora TaxID=2528407 RepID=A0AAV9X4A9_9PEZI
MKTSILLLIPLLATVSLAGMISSSDTPNSFEKRQSKAAPVQPQKSEEYIKDSILADPVVKSLEPDVYKFLSTLSSQAFIKLFSLSGEDFNEALYDITNKKMPAKLESSGAASKPVNRRAATSQNQGSQSKTGPSSPAENKNYGATVKRMILAKAKANKASPQTMSFIEKLPQSVFDQVALLTGPKLVDAIDKITAGKKPTEL